ncbi:zinc fingers and homeoboxes protein 3 [Epinephelus lanceolatus]|uniref:zinc fingers and homeoboxes protein 3 n=1 Tax=Epinephelus lanceolatus TaxID=310571 RepID=UPI0014454204|nr:zinc fingers and homeoboxes protein 3 [Epinephelus lanceolatus]XP_033483029.1 zinc fingers and homeoboxes protein 3 [Epinephelus lanceolatus]XP_033483030.1 zinc fingers and homeoboxes protein 3 [Epinephelus lanceolatus]XP_033483031.1 zinc fingers and homeoboxes protein 3 [Epinephelus lanceolatus]
MASKRKSTVPCMIPSKSKHVREEIILGSLPELLPTIPEDSILSISGEESGHFSHSSSKSESGSEMQKGGTYSCPKCRFESRDLNYFLDHMHNCHLDFRAQPTFYCLNCGVSVVRFEALALHNANAHPKIMEGLVTASLTVNNRDGVTTVEQSLFTDSGEDFRESGISLTKTPIAKMMKAKGEHKKIVVSHTVEVRKIDTGKDVDPSMLKNVPELQNGALSVSGAPAMPRTTVAHVIKTTVSNQVFHQHTPSLYSPPSSGSNKDLPKVMIPLSSIPTYDAAMDTSSFLKTSFGKFPYPTKAELCYLTVVSEFPEEQIKLWFTAQRLKQGISWSPEEIEEARRKMFNTVFQGGAPKKQPATQQHVNHIVTHHTVTAHPDSKGPNFQMAKVPYGGMKPRPVGVMATQASMSTNPHVTRVSYSTPIVPPKFPSVVRTTQVLTKNTQPTVEPDKSNGLGLDMAGSSGCVSSTSSSRSSSSSSSCSSSSSISSYSSSSNGGETVTRKPVHNSSPTNSINSIATCSTNISNNDEHCVADTNGKPNVKSNSLPIGLEGSNSTKGQVIIDNTSKSNVTCNNHNSGIISPQEEAHAAKPDDEHNNCIYKTNNSSISNDYPSTTCNDSVPNLNHASKSPTESTSTTVITKSSSSILDEGKCNKDFPIKGMSILQQLIKEEDPFTGDRSCPELKIDPIKINFKRLKMNEPDTTSEIVNQEHRSDLAEVCASQQSFPPPWANKTPQQLHILRQVFSSTRWPSSQQYEDLSVQTGLPKSEVVRWFSDSRYSHKNGQLKWLETYQRPTAPEEGRGLGDAEVESPKDSPAAKRKLVEQDMNKHLEGEAELNSGQRVVWQDSYSPLLGLMGSEGSGERGRADESAQPGVLQDPWSERAEDHQQPVANQSLIEQQTDANQARDRLRMELLEV